MEEKEEQNYFFIDTETKSDDDEVKKVKFLPIQDDSKAATKLDAASLSFPGSFPEPTYHLYLIVMSTNRTGIRISQFLCPH
jgi:hypothetical protein